MRMNPERSIQYTLVDWLRWKHPTIIFHANIFEQKATVAWRDIQKKMGFRKGVSDLFFPQSDRLGLTPKHMTYKGLWLELKTTKGKPTIEQEEFIQDMRDCGYAAFITYGYDEAETTIRWFFNLKN